VRLYYLDESEDANYYVRSALGVDAEVWSEVFSRIKDWRHQVKNKYRIPMHMELHAHDLLRGKGLPKFENGKYVQLCVDDGVAIFKNGLEQLERISKDFSKQVEVINICLSKKKYPNKTECYSLERILNRIQKSSEIVDRYVFCIFDQGKEKQITSAYRKALNRNPIPSKYGKWENGGLYKNIPPKRIVGNPAFRSSKDDYFLQMVDFVAHARLKRDTPPNERVLKYKINETFNILDSCLNRDASDNESQGVSGN
jgi:hypothetical protein